ncbi:DUF1093 domain-containing protein [Paenibacillus larvae]
MRKCTLYFGILFNFNRVFKDQAYTQIKEEGQLVNGQYEYTLSALNDKGEEIKVTFWKHVGGEKFKQDTYLRLYLKNKDGKKVITSTTKKSR